jgi:hypothetical protein
MAPNDQNPDQMTRQELIDLVQQLVQDNSTQNNNQQTQQLSRDQAEYNKVLKRTADLLGNVEESRRASAILLEQELMTQASGDSRKIEAMEKFIEAAKRGEQVALASTAATLGMTQQELKLNAERIRSMEQARQGQEKYGAEQKKAISDIADGIGLSARYSDSLVGSLVKVGAAMSKGGEEGEQARKAFVENFRSIFNFQNLALNVFNTIKENSMAVFESFDSAQASLAAATGQGRKFNDVLYSVGRNTNLFGVSMSEAADAIGTFVSMTSNFVHLNKGLQGEIGETVAMMGKLGVSASDAATIFQNFNQALGITAKQSIDMQRDLAMAGVDIGVGAAEIIKNFSSSLSSLMVYGKESINVFKGLQAAAKAASVETSVLLGIAAKFDTFAGSAEGVGKLNALLGTQLSTTEMLMATEDERVRMLVESVQSQGVAFQDMDRFTQKAIANAAGITDMAEANKIFGMSLKEYDENERKLKSSTNAQKKFEDAVAKTVELGDKMKLLGAEIIVALEPAFNFLSEVADSMIEFMGELEVEEKEMLGTLLAVGAGLGVLVPLVSVGGGLIAGLMAIPASIAGIGVAGAAAAPGVAAFAAAFAGVATSVLAIGAAVGLAGAGFGLLTGGGEESPEIGANEVNAMQSLESVLNADFSAAHSMIKKIVEEINKLGTTLEVRSTIENLALITAGKATSITGERVVANQTSVVANVQNFFQGMEMTLNVDGQQFKAYVASVTNGD